VDPRDIEAELNRAVACGEISEDDWYARVEALVADAYLASDDPRAQSGKSGDEVDWRWSRELVLDACSRDASLLDVGCANGYLMESLERWGRSRGMTISPYGLDISPRLVSLARERLPHWADRIATGNVMTWNPTRRFDVVHTGLDYVPAARRRDLVERIVALFLAPGGRLVLRAERERDPGDELRAMGFVCHALEAVHPLTGVMRRSVWLAAP
jgi:2-polyprenyl-3-methyl-5-hydroxy-6-metoxy-1,4-benzoquinol methylase